MKRRWQQGFLAIALALGLGGCFWGSEFETRHLIGHYYLDSIESRAEFWYLHFEDEEWGLADALINKTITEAGFNENCIVLRAVSASPEFYVVPLSRTLDIETREFARSKIVGPLDKKEFQAMVRRLNNGMLVSFNPELTSY